MQYIELYHVQLDKVLKAILRLYAGILHNYVNVQEYKIAAIAEIDIQLIKPSLIQLEKLGIIQYTPFKDKPQVQFIQERLRDYDMHIDVMQLKFLSDRYREQLQNIKEFCEQESKCRMIMLSTYFGEKENKTCNNCDNCIAQQHSDIDKKTFEIIINKIQEIINEDDEINAQDVVNKLSKYQQSDVNTILQYLINENKIGITKTGNIIWR
jgi:ATP-dependent DNA helicase RecQ